MFDLETAIKNWRAELHRQKVGGPEILDELESHLREEFDRLRNNQSTEEQVFQFAANKVGNVMELRREFATVRRQRGWRLRDVPWAMKIVAACFAFIGADFLCCSIGMVSQRDPNSSLMTGWLIELATMTVLGAGALIVASGLLRSGTRWRVPALAGVGLHAGYFVQGNWTYWQQVAKTAGSTAHSFAGSSDALIFGASVPIHFAMVFSVFEFAILLCGCGILLKPFLRNLFYPRATV